MNIMSEQQWHIVFAVSQRRQVNMSDIQPVIKIAAERFGGDEIIERLIRRRDDARINGNAPRAAYTIHLLVFEDAEDFGLRRQGHVADFIQKNRPVMRLFEFAALHRRRARKRAFFIAEQFAFNQMFRQRRAIDADERARSSGAIFLNETGDELFACAAFSGNQYRAVGRRNFLEIALYVADARTLPNQRLHAVAFGGQVAWQRRIISRHDLRDAL